MNVGMELVLFFPTLRYFFQTLKAKSSSLARTEDSPSPCKLLSTSKDRENIMDEKTRGTSSSLLRRAILAISSLRWRVVDDAADLER